MRSSSKSSRAKVLKGVDVEPYTLAVAPEEQTPAPPDIPASWDGRERRQRPVAEPWDGRERRSGRDVEVAREESFRDGYEAGKNDAERSLGAVRDQLQGALAALRLAAVQLDSRRADALTVAEEEVATLAFSVAEAVLQRELQLAVAPGRDAVARALSLLPDEVEVVVRMHPDDAACLDDLSDDSRRVVIVPDPDIERGGCVADAGACRIDTQVSTALERVRRVLCDGQVGA